MNQSAAGQPSWSRLVPPCIGQEADHMHILFIIDDTPPHQRITFKLIVNCIDLSEGSLIEWLSLAPQNV